MFNNTLLNPLDNTASIAIISKLKKSKDKTMLNQKGNKTTYSLALTGIIGSLYVILTLVFYPISFGPIQVRISELMAILPLFCGEAIVGLTIGCLISNLLGNGILDIIFGTLATLISALCTYFIGKKVKKNIPKFILGGFFPVILNAIIVPFTFLAITELKELYFISAIQVFIGQALSVYGLGGVVYFVFGKRISHSK